MTFSPRDETRRRRRKALGGGRLLNRPARLSSFGGIGLAVAEEALGRLARVARDLAGPRLGNGVASELGSHQVLDLVLLLGGERRSEEHTSELQSLMRISYAVFCLKKKK